MSEMKVTGKILAAMNVGYAECGICGDKIGLNDVDDYEAARSELLSHYHGEHDGGAVDE